MGEVKTRLARVIGAKAACEAYCQLVDELCERLSSLKGLELRFSPDDAADEIKCWQRQSWRLRPQGKGDLGQRMEAAFAEAFASRAERVVIIGSDCPAIAVDDIEKASAALGTADVVLGPARDGGYWLIGLRQPQPSLFKQITWSTDSVLKETLRRARDSQLQVKLLRELADVDNQRDWEDFLASKGLGSLRSGT